MSYYIVKLNTHDYRHKKIPIDSLNTTVEPRFNEVDGNWLNLFLKSRARFIDNLNVTNLRGNDQNIRYI